MGASKGFNPHSPDDPSRALTALRESAMKGKGLASKEGVADGRGNG
jgi:hypothetical protein